MGSLESFDGTKLSFDAEGPSDGPAVLLLHGYAMDGYSNWIRPGMTGRLASAGYRAIALDQRGHGMSGKPHDPAAYSDGAMVKDARALLDHLGLETVAAVGYSMGAMNTLRLLIDGEDRITAAVLGGIGGASIQARQGGDFLADAMSNPDRKAVTNPIAKSFRDYAETIGADLKALAALQRREVEPWGDVGGVTTPCLVLCADNDPLIGSPQELADRIPGAECVVVGGSHLNVVNNVQFHDAALAFLERCREKHKGA